MNKLTKLLSVFIIAGAVGASVAGVAGCKKGGGGHSHKLDPTKWENNFDGTHDGHCSCGELMVDDEDHTFVDGKCIKCQAPENEVLPGNVSLDTTSSTSALGREFNIVATISNAAELSAEQKVLEWDVEDDTVASITISADTATVTVKCLKVGSTKITVSTINGNTAEYNLTVTNEATGIAITNEAGTAIDRIALTPTSGDIVIKAAIQPSGSSDTEVEWTSSNPAVVTVTADPSDSTKATAHLVAQGNVGENLLITAKVKDKNITKTIFCTADTHYGTLIKDTENLIINENFSKYETGAVVPEWSGTWGTQAGVFGAFAQNKNDSVQGSYGETADSANTVKIVTEEANNNNNRAEMVDTSDSATHMIVDFGAVDGVVKGYANVKFLACGSSWTFAQFYGKDTKKAEGGEIFGLRTVEKTVDKVKKNIIKVRLDGDSGTSNSNCKDGLVEVEAAVGSSIRLYYEIDIKNDKITVHINGEKATGLGIVDVNGIKFVSGDGNTSSSGKDNTKTMSLDNIAVTHVGVSLDTLKTDLLARLDAEYAKYTEADYNADKWTTLSTAYNTAKTTINGSSDKDAMNAAYDTAVAAMKAVPTKAGEALYNAKEAYKTEIRNAYPAAGYTYNETAYTAAMNKLIAAIDAYSGEVGDKDAETGLYGDNAIKNAGNAFEAVKNDATVISEAKTAAVEELTAYKGGAAAHQTNATEYGAALELHTGNINLVVLPDSGVTKEIVEGKLADIAAALSAGKGAIDAINTDAQELTAAKTAAIEEITNYRKTEIDALKDAAEGTEEATVYKDIQGVVSRRTSGVDTATSITGEQGVEWNVEEAKQNIDSLLESLNKSLPDVKTDELALLKAEYDKAVAAHSDIKAHLDKVYNAAVTNINNATAKTEATNVRIAATTELNVVIAKDAAYKEIVAYATEVKADLHSNSAKADIDKEILYDLDSILTATPDPSGWSSHMWAIHNSTVISGELADGTKVGVNVTKKVVLDTIDKIAADAKNASFEVTLGTTGETLTVKYGTELKLGDLFVTAYNVTAAEFNGTQITADAGVTVYDDITIDVTLAEIEGFEASTDWKVAAGATAPTTGVVIDNALFSITAPTGTTYGAANTGFTSVCGEPNALHYVVPAATLEGGKVSVKGDNKDNPYQITVKSSLAKLDIFVSLSDSKGSGDRTGSIYYSVDGGLTYKTVDGVKNKTIALTDVAAGTVIKIYADNASIKSSDGSAMDARLYLAKVEAAIDESKVEQTVHVTWKGAGEGGADLTVDYRYYDKITAPVPANLGGDEAFEFWHIEGDENDKWVNNSTLTGGSYVYVAKTKQVAAVATVTLTAGTEIEIGSTLELTVAATDTEGGDGLTGREVTWTVTGKAEVKQVEGKYVLSLTEGAAAADTITVKATVGGVDSEVKSITVKAASQEGWKKDFSVGAPTDSNLSYNSGDKIDAVKTATGGGTFAGAIEVTDSTSSKCNWNKGGYFKGSQNAVISITTNAAASLIIVDANSNSARSYTVKDSTGNVIKTHTMNNGSETITLAAAGTYTISFAGGECRIKSIELKP